MIQPPIHDDLPAPTPICGFPVRPISQEQLIEQLIARAQGHIRTCVHYLNTHTFNLTTNDPGFRDLLATSDLLYADSMSVVWAGRWLGHRVPERLSAADYFEAFCRRCAREDVSLVLAGRRGRGFSNHGKRPGKTHTGASYCRYESGVLRGRRV